VITGIRKEQDLTAERGEGKWFSLGGRESPSPRFKKEKRKESQKKGPMPSDSIAETVLPMSGGRKKKT